MREIKFLDCLRRFFGKKCSRDIFFCNIENYLGVKPNSIVLYENALRHKQEEGKHEKLEKNEKESSESSNNSIIPYTTKVENERLEFLGDAVLETVVSDIIYKQYPNYDEGKLTSLRSKIVKRQTLNEVAGEMGFEKIMNCPDYLGNHVVNVYGNALEAFIGAIFLDKGFGYTYQYIEKLIKNHIDVEKLDDMESNYKSRMIEWSQRHRVKVDFETTFEEVGEYKLHLFTSKILLNDIEVATGQGDTKRASHQQASQRALERISSDNVLTQKICSKLKETE